MANSVTQTERSLTRPCLCLSRTMGSQKAPKQRSRAENTVTSEQPAQTGVITPERMIIVVLVAVIAYQNRPSLLVMSDPQQSKVSDEATVANASMVERASGDIKPSTETVRSHVSTPQGTTRVTTAKLIKESKTIRNQWRERLQGVIKHFKQQPKESRLLEFNDDISGMTSHALYELLSSAAQNEDIDPGPDTALHSPQPHSGLLSGRGVPGYSAAVPS